MEFDPTQLESRREQAKQELGRLATERYVQEAKLLALDWQDELMATLRRGGTTRSAPPYDFEGAWRLVASDDQGVAYKPVIAEEELPPDITPSRKVVKSAELAHGACKECSEVVPLIGLSKAVGTGFGDVSYKANIAVVHCNKVQIKRTKGLPFRPSMLVID